MKCQYMASIIQACTICIHETDCIYEMSIYSIYNTTMKPINYNARVVYKYLCMSINHLADNGFIILRRMSTSSSTLTSSCLQIISPYQF